MTDKPSHPIRQGLIVTVLGGIILLLISDTIRKICWMIVKAAGNFFSHIWTWIFTIHQLPGWFIIILVVVMPAIFLVLKLRGSRADIEQEHFKYTEDFYEGAKWRWNWVNSKIVNLWAFCPKCDGLLVFNDTTNKNIMLRGDKTSFICENCDRAIFSKVGNRDYVLAAAAREIDRRIRTGEYKDSIKPT